MTALLKRLRQIGPGQHVDQQRQRNHHKQDESQPAVSEEASTLMAQEMLQLSSEERQQVYHEIHGVEDQVCEEMDMVSHAIDDLNHELDKILYNASPSAAFMGDMFGGDGGDDDDDGGNYYENILSPYSSLNGCDDDDIIEVLQTYPSYVRNVSFQLMFLRAEKYNAKLACCRMVHFFKEKRILFGSHTLGRDITLNDMDERDMELLQSGYMQILPQRDRAGRAVWFSLSHKRKGRHLKCVARTWFYMVMAALEDEETQIKGFCNIKYDYSRSVPSPANTPTLAPIGNSTSGNRNGDDSHGDHDSHRLYGDVTHDDEKYVTLTHCQIFHQLEQALPFRINALHVCYINPALRDLFSIAVANISKHQRARLRFHYGPHMECQYELMTFGIRPDALPVSSDGEERLENHYQWIQHRRAKEAIQLLMDRDSGDVQTFSGNSIDNNSKCTFVSPIPIGGMGQDDPYPPLFDSTVPTINGKVESTANAWPGLTFDENDNNTKSDSILSSFDFPSNYDNDDCTPLGDFQQQPSKPSVIEQLHEEPPQQQPPQQQQQPSPVQRPRQPQQCQQQPKNQKKIIAVPKHEDVILGRGNKNHYGNMRFREIIDSHREQYEASDKAGKTSISELIVQQVKERGGRFLKNDVGGWTELSDAAARYKVSHRFRNMRILDGGGGGGSGGGGSNNAKNNKVKIDATPIPTNSNASILSVPVNSKRGRQDDQGWFCTPKDIRLNH